MLVEANFISRRYGCIVSCLPVHLQNRAGNLPFLLGVIENENGRWEDYTKIRVSYDLPGLILNDHYAETTPENFDALLESFRYLHLYILLYFLCHDRIADKDIEGSEFLDELCACFKQEIIARINQRHLGDGERDLQEYFMLWKCGVAAEQKCLALGSLSLSEYGNIIRNKNRYLTMAARIFLRQNQVSREECYSIIMDGMITALQCRGDALTWQDDRDHYGISFPEILQRTHGELYGSSIILMKKLCGFAEKQEWKNLSEGIMECINQQFPIALEKEVRVNHLSSILTALQVFPPLTYL